MLKMTTTQRRYHVALVDFLPAGLEPINPELNGLLFFLISSPLMTRIVCVLQVL
jgi:hypothetical protein